MENNGNPGSSDASSFEGENLMDYAFGKNNDIHFEIRDNFLQIHYSKRLSADDLVFNIQSSLDLNDWTEVNNLYDMITMRSINKINKKRIKFLRIQVRTRN